MDIENLGSGLSKLTKLIHSSIHLKLIKLYLKYGN